jgi:hypothetical protein
MAEDGRSYPRLQGALCAGFSERSYDQEMRRALWPLIFSLLLQLLAGNAWAGSMGHPQPGHCHDAATSVAVAVGQASSSDAVDVPGSQVDSHHCCAVGQGWLEPPLQAPPPQAAPTALVSSWLSLALRPDLRPPI